MASGQQQSQANLKCCHDEEPWKLKDKVKILRICCSDVDEKTQMRGTRPTQKVKQGPKKWMKKDAYLFQHEMPTICLFPRGTDLSSSTREMIHLDGIIFIRNVSRFFKNNVLAIAFSSCYLLLSFESKSRRELWFSEIMYLTDVFTVLLYKCSHQSVKLGYYQLRFMLGNLVVYDAITKKTAWKWDISHIHGYCFEKASAIRIEVGRVSSMDGFFCFTGKNIKPFCKRLQTVGQRIADKRSSSLQRYTDLTNVKLNCERYTTHTFPKSNGNCSYDSQFNCNASTSPLCIPPVIMINSSSGALSDNQLDVQHNDTPSPTSLQNKKYFHSLQCLPFSNEITHDKRSTSRESFSHAVIKRSLSISTLDDYRSGCPDGLWKSRKSSRSGLKLLRQYCSLDNLSTTSDLDEEDYVVQSLYSSKSISDYLELLPGTTYEQIQDDHVYDEIITHKN